MHLVRHLLLCTLALMALLVCGSCTEKDPSLTGTWTLAEDSARNFGMPGHPQIVLNLDPSFTASEIQKELLYNPEPLSGSGTWKRSGDEIFLAFSKINGTDKNWEIRLGIADEDKKPKLFFYRGDRTSGYRFFFEKL